MIFNPATITFYCKKLSEKHPTNGCCSAQTRQFFHCIIPLQAKALLIHHKYWRYKVRRVPHNSSIITLYLSIFIRDDFLRTNILPDKADTRNSLTCIPIATCINYNNKKIFIFLRSKCF
uniref:Uncharacterized protein n=1 Tax=Opuntia streptacantha TaxID=393608 RepID=A0A7C8ZSF7_OPUST